MLIDQLMPEFHVTERHQLPIPAPPEVVFAALYQVDLFDSVITAPWSGCALSRHG